MLLYLVISSVLVAHGMAGVSCPEKSSLYSVDNVCIAVLLTQVTFTQAESLCKQNNGKLVEIKDATKKQYLESQLSATVWLGMTDEDGNEEFNFLDGSPVTYYSPWLDPIAKGDKCAIQSTTGWTAVPCDAQHGAACETPAIVTCDENKWIVLPGTTTCARVFKGNKNKVTYVQAKAKCTEMGGKLIGDIQSRRNIKAIMGTIKYRAHMWIGVDDLDKDRIVNFVDSTPVEGHMPFKKGRGLKNRNLCGSLKLGKWFGRRCDRKQIYVCEKAG